MRPILKLVFILLPLYLQAQWGPYHYERQLGTVESGWHAIELPDDIFHNLKFNYADLRIMGIQANGDTIEAPYLLQLPEERPAVEKMAFSLLNQSRQNGSFFATLESATSPRINRIQLKIDNPNFDWRVNLEGSNDQKQWFELIKDYRILAIDDQAGRYAFTTLHFPEAQYQYYRISILTEEEVKLSAATSSRQSQQEVIYRTYPVLQRDIRENSKEKRTEVTLDLQWPVPVSFLSLGAQETFDYYRPIEIQLLQDSTKTEQGWQYRYETVHTDVLSSLEERKFTFPPTRSNRLKLLVDNYDNAPLHLDSFDIKGQTPVLKVRVAEAAEYHLLYGWADARPPHYDLGNFQDKIPEEIAAIKLGPEIRLQAEETDPEPLLVSRVWLWGVLILVIAVLGWFSIRMLGEAK